MRALSLLLALIVLTQSGCSLGKRLKAAAYDPADQQVGKATGEYDYIGKSFRGPLENENDPLKKLMFSDKALEIERNVGIGP